MAGMQQAGNALVAPVVPQLGAMRLEGRICIVAFLAGLGPLQECNALHMSLHCLSGDSRLCEVNHFFPVILLVCITHS